jgi:serine/threonine protein kinase
MSVVSNRALPQGYRLQNYRIDRAISRGGFSIVYRAVDDNGQVVAIKEYLPSGLVLRTDGSRVHASSIENLDSFRFGMKCFFDEGKSLASINHPNVVRVLNFFRANETVYMVMKYERGRTLQQYIQGNQGLLPEGLIRHVFSRLLTGLREVHSRRLLHLDIKPANIYIRTDGSPVLLDFGAARQVLTTRGSKVTPMYTPGFAAPEQYREGDADRLGPWTDLYGVGASLFACFAAFAPQAADSRVKDEHYVSARKLWGGKYSDALLDLVDQCLRLDALQRPQSVMQVQKLLINEIVVEKPTFAAKIKAMLRGKSRK